MLGCMEVARNVEDRLCTAPCSSAGLLAHAAVSYASSAKSTYGPVPLLDVPEPLHNQDRGKLLSCTTAEGLAQEWLQVSGCCIILVTFAVNCWAIHLYL